MTDFGSGFRLDQDLDLVLSPSGDISTVQGIDELRKDLSYRLIDELDSIGTMSFSKDAQDRLKARVAGVVRSDPRVESVTHISVQTTQGHSGSLQISIDATTAEGPFDMVVNV